MPIPRTYSDKFIEGSNDMDLGNKNVEWMNGPEPKYVRNIPSSLGISFFRPFRLLYILLVFFGWGLLHITRLFDIADSLMALNIIHGVITFIMFHWIKGCPDETSQVQWFLSVPKIVVDSNSH